MGDEHHLPLVAIFDTDIVVFPLNVKLGEMASVFQLVHKVRDKRERVGILGSVFIEVSIILAGAKFAIFFLHKEKGRCLRGVRGMNLLSG